MRRMTSMVLSLIALALVGGTGSAAAALHLDRGYGENGLAVLPGLNEPDEFGPEALVGEPDGGLIVRTGQTLQRLGPEGELDPSFGAGGSVVPPPLEGGTLEVVAAAVDSQGRVVVVGTSTPAQPEGKELPLHASQIYPTREFAHTDVRIFRYLPNGALDPSFGEGGIVETDLGLPTPESQGVKLSAAPVVEATGVAVDGQGQIVITGGAGVYITAGGCFHDDYFPTLSYAAFVARLTEAGSLDRAFGKRGVFGGRSKSQNPLGMEDATEPAIAPGGGIVFRRGSGHCARFAGSLGFVRLTPAGEVRSWRGPHALRGRVIDATAAPDGTTVLLLGPLKGSERLDRIVELRPNGSPDKSFGRDGTVTPRFPDPGRSYVSRIRVAPSGEVLAQAVYVPEPRKGEGEAQWRARFSVVLAGFRRTGAPDTRIGPQGFVVRHIPHWYGNGDFWLDGYGRAIITVATNRHDQAGTTTGLAAIRFEPPRG